MREQMTTIQYTQSTPLFPLLLSPRGRRLFYDTVHFAPHAPVPPQNQSTLLDLPDGRRGAHSHYVWVKNLLWLVTDGHEDTHTHAHKV